MFYDVQADGYSLDDKRQEITESDLPDVLENFQQRHFSNADISARTVKAFTVPATEIRANKYDLSINRYKQMVQEVIRFDPPSEILSRMKELEIEIQTAITELEEML